MNKLASHTLLSVAVVGVLSACGANDPVTVKPTNTATPIPSTILTTTATPSTTLTATATTTATPSLTTTTVVTDSPSVSQTTNPSLTATISNSQTPTSTLTVTQVPQSDEFADFIYPVVVSDCMLCHVVDSGNPAGNKAYSFVNKNTDNHLEINRERFNRYVTNGNGQKLLDKPRGIVSHSGGFRTVLTDNDANFNRFSAYVLGLTSVTATPSVTATNTPSTTNTAAPTATATPSTILTATATTTSTVTSTPTVSITPTRSLDSITFADPIYPEVVQAKCMLCHVPAGLASSSNLVFTGNDAASNQIVFDAYIDNDSELGILNKVQGLAGHGGGLQLIGGSELYNWFAYYVNTVAGNDHTVETGAGLFAKVSFESNRELVNRAALLFTGHYADAALLQQADVADQAQLKQLLIDMMQGDGFHDFLIRGANDQLLTDKLLANADALNRLNQSYLEYMAMQYKDVNDQLGEGEWASYRDAIREGIARAPLELIAYVVMNDRPYSEILTADYTMMTPELASMYQADLTFAAGEKWKPGQNKGYLRDATSNTFTGSNAFGFQYDGTGISTEIPHAGLLSDHAFLKRYPSTATNRNRARARWAYYYFLAHDIEASATRTTDQTVLADTNNPTMNNPACTVCHITMDPVAGAFQNYGDDGYYRDQVGGDDSLPFSYRRIPNPENPANNMNNPLYTQGVTAWYGDMRTPGFSDDIAPDNRNSLQWLAQQMVADQRFAKAAVKFWWAPIMGHEYSAAPAEQGDLNYNEDLARYQAQEQLVVDIADQFRSHLNLKQVLADLMLSDFSRAASAQAEAMNDKALLNIGNERLLTPAELADKTKALTGYVWNTTWNPRLEQDLVSELHVNQRVNFGGIDSDNVITRMREPSAFMTGVATRQALMGSCPIVAFEFDQPMNERKLLNQVDEHDLPGLLRHELITISADSLSNMQQFSWTKTIETGALRLMLRPENYLQEGSSYRRVVMNSISIFDANNNLVIQMNPGQAIADNSHSAYWRSASNAYSSSVRLNNDQSGFTMVLPINESGEYRVEVSVFAEQVGNELAKMNVYLLEGDLSKPHQAGVAVKAMIAQLYQHMLGAQADATEIEAIYQLFNNAWLSKFDRQPFNNISGNGAACSYVPAELIVDRNNVKSAWRAVMAYLLMDYQFLYQ